MTQVVKIIPGVGEKITSRKACNNITRHKWDCLDFCECGIRRSTVFDGYRVKTIYFDKFGHKIGDRAPECTRNI